MPAYMIFIREQTLDRTELEAYWAKVAATLEGVPIKVTFGLWSPRDT